MDKPKIVDDFRSYVLDFLDNCSESDIYDLCQHEVGIEINNILIDKIEEIELNNE